MVDVQPTFCEGGELGVAGGNAVAERIARGMLPNIVASTHISRPHKIGMSIQEPIGPISPIS